MIEHEQAILDLALMETDCSRDSECTGLDIMECMRCTECVPMFPTLRMECDALFDMGLLESTQHYSNCKCQGRGWLPVDDLQVLMDVLSLDIAYLEFDSMLRWTVHIKGTGATSHDLAIAARNALNTVKLT